MGRKAKKRAETITLADHLRSIAAKGGKARMQSMTDEQRRQMGRKGGLVGGEARWRGLTTEQRSEIARKAAKARGKAAKKRVEALSRRPYDVAHEQRVHDTITVFTQQMRDVLKYILHHPDIEGGNIPIPDGAGLARECYRRGFLDMREYRPGNGLSAMATYYTVKPNFRNVLEDYLSKT